MNDSEVRRRELLRQTRKLYQEHGAPPAIHPRYGHIYHELYDEEPPVVKSTFFYRFILGILCFICYVWMDHGKISIADVSSDKIVSQIEKQVELQDIREVWRPD